MIFSARNVAILVLGSMLLISCSGSNKKKKTNARNNAAPQVQPQQPVQPQPQQQPSTDPVPVVDEPNSNDNVDKRPPAQPPKNNTLGTMEVADLKINLKNLVSVNMRTNNEKLEILLLTKNESNVLIERLDYVGQLESHGNFSPLTARSDKSNFLKGEARCIGTCERILVKLKKQGIGELYLAFEATKKESGWAHLSFMPGLTEDPDAQTALKRSHVNEEVLTLSDALDISSGGAQGIMIEVKVWLRDAIKAGDQDALVQELQKLINSLMMASSELNSAVEDLDRILLLNSLESLKETLPKIERAKQALETALNTLISQAPLIPDERVRFVTKGLSAALASTKNAFERLPSISKP